MHLVGMGSIISECFGYGIVICIGAILLLIPLSTWLTDFGGLMLVALGTAIICLGEVVGELLRQA